MLRISINTIPHSCHRYETVGDYLDHPNGDRSIYVSDMSNPDYELLVAIHEAVEQHLCLRNGITEKVISDFDKAYELKRPQGDVSEPGDAEDCPYRKEHQFATGIERQIAEEMGIDWDTYESTINKLGE